MARPAILAMALLAATLSSACAGTAADPAGSAVDATVPATAAAAAGATATTPVTAPPANAPSATAPVTAPPTTSPGDARSPSAPRLGVTVVERLPHDRGAFTEGLLLVDGELYESTGLVGASSVRQVDPATGKVLRQRDLAPPLFGEGLAAAGDRLVMLSWTSGVATVFDRATLSVKGTFPYQGEGWGLCFDGTAFVQSNGSSKLLRRDPTTFELLGTVDVVDNGRPVTQLNELECVDGSIYANIWLSTDIVRIDAATGRVTARIDASTLKPPGGAPDDVLNGIAYDRRDGTFLLTGKRWDTLYRVRLGG